MPARIDTSIIYPWKNCEPPNVLEDKAPLSSSSSQLNIEKILSERALIDPPSSLTPKSPLNFSLEQIVFDIYSGLEKTLNQDKETSAKIAEKTVEESERLRKKKLEELKEYVINIKERSTWEIVQKVATYIAFAGSIVLGIETTATGGGAPVGIMLIASGILGITNQIISDIDGWKDIASYFTNSQEAKDQIASNLETGATILSIALSVLGLGYNFLSANALSLNMLSSTKLSYIIFGGSSAIAASAKLGKGYADYKVFKNEAGLTEIRAAEITIQNHLKMILDYLKRSLDDDDQFIEKIRFIINLYANTTKN